MRRAYTKGNNVVFLIKYFRVIAAKSVGLLFPRLRVPRPDAGAGRRHNGGQNTADDKELQEVLLEHKSPLLQHGS